MSLCLLLPDLTSSITTNQTVVIFVIQADCCHQSLPCHTPAVMTGLSLLSPWQARRSVTLPYSCDIPVILPYSCDIPDISLQFVERNILQEASVFPPIPFHAVVRMRIWSMMGKRFECFAKLWFFVDEGAGGGESAWSWEWEISEAEIKWL